MTLKSEQAVIEWNPANEHQSLLYARVREALEVDAAKKFPNNNARRTTWKHEQKRGLVSAVGGAVKQNKMGLYVVFPDGTKAHY